ncbi:insulinase family protein [Sphingomonas sp. SUN019]|uniref:M16 family metallopeptidase n=1 Tax=Sphingomonas sp. SUN019 TaxID=2937788 RepID=UPI0021644C58|nr:M16 family metallopeptidase [Sphingomonas sp. SUN019]UVO49883.1 insulinase family protein [Sphingomonas sp. SUN019]
MTFPKRALSKPLVLALLLTTVALPALAQRKPARPPAAAPAPAATPTPIKVDTSPWLFKGSDIPPDPAWNFGTLPNGLRYAIRRNGVPPGQVAVRVRIDAGSLNETDDQRGYAHLIEHLSFRGSKYVPDGEAKRVWQRFGATFGSDSNAQTTPTQTVYKLDLPGATEAKLDESLKIFSGMMEEPGINTAGLTAERPAVLAEQREAPGPQVRLYDARNALFFAGQPLADRSPIGTIKMLEAATPESVKAFHDKWYRPARTVVVISGDIDPAVAADLVVKHLGGWAGKGPNPADSDFGKPDPKAPTTATIVEPAIQPLVIQAVVRPWTYRDDTIDFNQKRMVDFIAVRVINRRLETRARAGGSFLQASVSLDDVSRSANGTFTAILPIGDDWEAALKDVRAVIADAMATAPTQAEIDRELVEYDSAMKNDVATARVEAGTKQTEDMVGALDIRETVAGPQESYNIFLGAKQKNLFTPAAVLESTNRVFKGDATRALLNTRVADPGATAKLAAALEADVKGLAGKRAQQAEVNFDKLPSLGKPGTVTTRETVADPGMEKIVFSNGVRMLMYANASETGRVYLRVRFGNGYAGLPANKPTPAWAGDIALVAGGIGKLGQGDLDTLTAGRRMGLDFDIADDAFTLSAQTTPGDYADNLRLMATKLAAPGWDPAPVARARALMLSGYAGLESSPDGVISRDLDNLLRGGDPRFGMPKQEQVAALTPKDFRKFWEPLLATGQIEVDVFGDVKPEEAVAAVAKTFGALKPRKPATALVPVRFPDHNATPLVRTHNGADTQAAAVIAWPTAGGSADIAESRRLDILAAIFADRLFDRLRSVAGASYSPSAASQWPVGLAGGGRLIAVGQVAPANVDLFFKLSREIAAQLVATPVDADELKRAIDPQMRFLERASTGNQFWLMQTSGGTYDANRLANVKTLVTDYVTITPQSLQATAAKYLQPTKDWTMAVIPKTAPAGTADGVAKR